MPMQRARHVSENSERHDDTNGSRECATSRRAQKSGRERNGCNGERGQWIQPSGQQDAGDEGEA